MAYMQSAIPTAADFESPDFAEFCNRLCRPPQLHRKLWEWAFIFHHLLARGKLVRGARGLGFGVGQERLPALFAAYGCSVLATDGPPELAAQWGKQHNRDKSELFFEGMVEREAFEALVHVQTCDMKAIPADLTDFDFCWSACAFEHLGSLEEGMDFVVNSMRTLKPGGIAVHTTEFNLSSDEDTVAEGGTVIYRKRDIERLHGALRRAGYGVRALPIMGGSTPLDQHIDLPPYTHNPHLKLRLGNYIATSIGVVAERSTGWTRLKKTASRLLMMQSQN